MIKVNGITIEQNHFGDNTLKCNIPNIGFDCMTDLSNILRTYVPKINILWCYDSDDEIFTLICIVDYIKDNFEFSNIELEMPYIPHARQDRMVSDRLFTLKSFSKIINSLHFDSVSVVDPHSDVSTALIDRVRYSYDDFEINQYIPYKSAIMFPDNGAAKKYMSHYSGIIESCEIIVGNKIRNAEGRIEKYELMNCPDHLDTVVIRDDICSYGGTFSAAAKELRKRGAKRIILIVTHCENNIIKGDVLNNVDIVYTTDSILTIQHPKIEIIRSYR